MNRSLAENPSRTRQLHRGPITWLLDLFSNVWLAVVLMVLLFVYSSIGSAYPPFRQHRLLEMTEFEWFHWWPFLLLIGLLALTLCTTTIRRIPLKLVNAGVWMIHSGIIILISGSVYYFGSKVEGDVPIFRRKVVIEVPGAKQTAELVARPGNQITVTGLAGEYEFAIASLQPEWPILTGDDAGEKAYSVSVMVTTPRQKFVRQLLAGYPQYTEDIIPGQGRAVKSTGKKLLDETLKLTLDYESQTHFFVQGTSAVYLRPKGSKEWVARPIQGLPRYHERISSREHLWNSNPAEQRIDPLDLELTAVDEQDAFADVDFRVDSYLPYAIERMQWIDGGTVPYPIIGLSVHSPEGHADYELAAFDPRTKTGQGGKIVFHWVESAEQLEPYANPQPARLRVEVLADDITLEIPISDLEASGTDALFRKIEGSSYEFRLRNRLDNFAAGDGRILSLLIVEIKTPEKTFTRWVADDPRSTRDMSAEGSGTGHQAIEPDANIVMTYTPAPPPITVVAGPAPMGAYVFLDRGDGTVQRFSPQVGEALTLAPGWILTIKHLHRNARPEFRPSIVPVHRRDRNARRLRSMIHLTLSTADWQQSLWLPFNQHVFRDEQYRIAGRTFYTPRDLELPDGRRIELMFSRERYAFPAAVALDDFTLLTHQGGLVGSNSNVRNYVSRLRFADGSGGWSEPNRMSLNEPAENQGWWFFQSTWDPPAAGGYAGMNFTGVGVGNRNGVRIQLFGVCLAVTGMLFAFYVKPIILRRQRVEAFARLERDQGSESTVAQPASGAVTAITEPVATARGGD